MYVKGKSEGIAVSDSGLAACVAGIRKSLGESQATFGKRFGVSQVAVSRWEQGADTPAPKTLLALAELTSDQQAKDGLLAATGLHSLSGPSGLEEPKVRYVRLLKDAVAAGTPRATDEREIEAMLPFTEQFFPRGGELYALKVAGDSMAPTVLDGYIVIVDTSQRDAKKLLKRMVAAREGDAVTIKWLRNDGDTYILVPQHTSLEHPVRIMRADGDFSIVGAVIYLMGAPPAIRK